MDETRSDPEYDLAIIGGGINGCGIARDAAGRGWRVFLCEQADLGSGTSSASTKLIHGGLRYLEHLEFRLVREALMEREVLWGIAPHIIRPLRFILPHHLRMRPAWMLRLGLFIYDHLGGRRLLPPTETLDLRTDPAGVALKPDFTRGFAYSDCWVEDSRLVVLNARDAAERGATIAPRTACVSAEREGAGWTLRLQDSDTSMQRTVRAGALVNAAGPWVAAVARSVIHSDGPVAVRLVQGSHIVVRRLYDHDACYILQNGDGRIVFLIPYEGDFTLIGTTDEDFAGDPAEAKASAAEIAYLCEAASRYLRKPVSPDRVVWSYVGVRPLYDDGSGAPQQATRDYVLTVDAPAGAPALLSVFGGKITTYRRLAEAALAALQPHLPIVDGTRRGTEPAMSGGGSGQPRLQAGWTGRTPLPGGDFPVDGFDRQVKAAMVRYPFLPEPTIRRMVRAYGTRIDRVIGGATCVAELGPVLGADLGPVMRGERGPVIGTEFGPGIGAEPVSDLGAEPGAIADGNFNPGPGGDPNPLSGTDLTEAELRYLIEAEWARTAADVIWRRSKLGLRMSSAQIAAVEAAMNRLRTKGSAPP